jgi:hypothetical protein
MTYLCSIRRTYLTRLLFIFLFVFFSFFQIFQQRLTSLLQRCGDLAFTQQLQRQDREAAHQLQLERNQQVLHPLPLLLTAESNNNDNVSHFLFL